MSLSFRHSAQAVKTNCLTGHQGSSQVPVPHSNKMRILARSAQGRVLELGTVGKTFTLSEAQTLLPLLDSLLVKAQAAGRKAAELEAEMQQLTQRIFLSGGLNVDVPTAARRRAERENALKEVQDTLAEIDEIGVQVKDLNRGLLDFPCLLDGETVLLCWKQGEKEIGFWHTVEAGFAGRRPVDSRFGRVEKDRLN